MNNSIRKRGFLSSMLTVTRKEWLDFYRDRRTFLLSLLVAPLLYPVIFLGIGKLTQLRSETQLEKSLDVPVAGMSRAPNLINFLASYGIDAQPTSKPACAHSRKTWRWPSTRTSPTTGMPASRPRSTSSPTPPAATATSRSLASAKCWRATAMAWGRCAC
jgi:hypothetical protein